MIFRVIFSTMIVQMKQSFARPMFRFCLLANPMLNTILLYEMYKNSGEENFMAYVVLGAGLMGLWGCICFSSAGDINRERYSGTPISHIRSSHKLSNNHPWENNRKHTYVTSNPWNITGNCQDPLWNRPCAGKPRLFSNSTPCHRHNLYRDFLSHSLPSDIITQD